MTGGSSKEPSQILRDAVSGAPSRLEWVDTAKGLGIILVVIAHVWTKGPVRDFIYSFHMPLFFLLSGYMSKPRPMGEFFGKQVRAMAVPYVAFLLLLAGFDHVFETWRGVHPLFRDWHDALWRLSVGGSELRGPFTIFWFVPALFFGRLLQNLIFQLVPDSRESDWRLLMGVSLIMGLWIGKSMDFSPLGLLAVPMVLVFLWLGALWRASGDDRQIMMMAFPVAVAGTVLLHHYQIFPLNMKVGDYFAPILSLPTAIALSLCVCAIARHIPGDMLKRMLARLGRISLVIMYLHVAVVHYLAPYFPDPATQKWILLGLAFLVPVLFNWIFTRFAVTRRLFLGSV